MFPSAGRRFQFRLWHLLWVMFTTAIILSLLRLGVVLGSLVTFFVTEVFVVLVGTTLIVNRVQSKQGAGLITRGGLSGAVLSAILIGWVFLPRAIFVGDQAFCALFGVTVVLGGLIGSSIGVVIWWRRSHENVMPPITAVAKK